MKVHLIENNKIVNTIEIDSVELSLELFPDILSVSAELGGNIGDTYNPETGEFTQPVPVKIVPQSVTMRQARLALLQVGKLGNVPSAIEMLSSPHKEIAQIEWEFSSTVERNRPLVQALGPLLELSEEELDDLFILAGTL